MVVNRAAFAQALKRVMPGVENGKSLLQGADTFVFKKGVVYSFNENISVSVILPEGLGELAGAVKAQEFFGLISKFSGETVELTITEENWVLTSGEAEATLALLQEKVSDRIALIGPKDDWLDVPVGFLAVLGGCVLANNSSALSGVYCSDKLLVSTDEMRINALDLSADMGTWWVSDSAAMELLKLPALKQYQLGDGWLHFATEDQTVISLKRLVADKYPFGKLRAVVAMHAQAEDDFTGTLPVGLRDAVERASTLSTGIESFDAVDLTFDGAGIFVASQRSTGKYKEMVKWDAPLQNPEVDAFKITLDKGMVASGLKLAKTFYLKEVKLKGGMSKRLVFKAEHGVQLVSALEAEAPKETKPKKATKAAADE